MDAADPDVLDLRDYLQVLRRRWTIIATAVVVTVLAALTVGLLQTPVYEGTAELAIEPVRRSADASLEDLILGDTVVETERRVITSRPVTTRVIEELQLGDVAPSELVEQVRVSVVTDTRVVDITASDTDPAFAASLANAYADAYLDYRRDRAIDEVSAARSNLDERAQELRDQIDQIDQELAADGDGAGTDDGSIAQDDATLESQRETLVQQLAQVESQLATIDVGGQAIRGGGEVLVPAEESGDPVSPRPLRTGVLALVLGLMLGVGLAFLRDHFDDAIRTDEDVRRVGGGRPNLGRVTHWTDPRADERLITLVDPHDPASEEYRALSANVRFALVGHDATVEGTGDGFRHQSVLVTSAASSEGKTTTAANLAVAASAAGLRVILVEADLRQPTMSQRFGVPETVGMSDLLVDPSLLTSGEGLAEHLLDVGSPRLRVLPAGTVPPNPTELLASPRMAWLHRSLVGVADLVVYDTPPVLPVADTLELATHVDAALVVVRTGSSHRRELQHAMERLDAIGAEVGGFVVNDISKARRSGYGYGYGYREHSYRPRGGGVPGANGRPGDATTRGAFVARLRKASARARDETVPGSGDAVRPGRRSAGDRGAATDDPADPRP